MKVSKYWQFFKMSLQCSLVYRFNFLMWRLRRFVTMLALYYFWQSVYRFNFTIGSYEETSMLTYYILSNIIGNLIFANWSSTELAVDIANGRLNQGLLKPFSYLKRIFALDGADKFSNFILNIIEMLIFFLLFKPLFFFQKNILILIVFFIFIILAIIINFYLNILVSCFAFWYPEHGGWAARFVFMVTTSILTGEALPLDILPKIMFKIFSFLPFSALTFFPLQIYLGRLDFRQIITTFLLMGFWLIVLPILTQKVWQRGLKNYCAVGI